MLITRQSSLLTVTNYAPVGGFSAKCSSGKEHRILAGKGYTRVTTGRASSVSHCSCHDPLSDHPSLLCTLATLFGFIAQFQSHFPMGGLP